MDREIESAVTDWESRRVTGGYAALRELADEEFTGAVTDGSAWLFFTNGRVVAEIEGEIETFEQSTATAYTAPDPSVGTLYAMRALGGETKARYYTEDTSLASAAETLADNNFTGYVELSENVLSGDYYLVFSSGRRTACAFVGSSRDLVTGEAAFDRAADEVGIYEVVDVDVGVTEIPEEETTAGSESAPTASDGATVAGDEVTSDATTGITNDASDAGGVTADAGADGATDTGVTPDASRTDADVTSDASRTDADVTSDASRTDADVTSDASRTDASERTDAGGRTDASEGTDTDRSTAGDSTGGVEETASENGTDTASVADARPNTAGAERSSTPSRQSSAEETWQTTRTIPSLDPSDSSTDGQPSEETETESSRSTPTTGETNGRVARSSGRVTELKRRLSEAQEARETAKRQLSETRARLEDREETIDRLQSENERLQSRVAELEAEVERLDGQLADVEEYLPDGDEERTPETALSGTNLFVRYGSKGGATLETAHAGGATRQEVEENLRLETHTDFAADRTVVDGVAYDEFLTDTVEYNFVVWIVEELLYEIQETGTESAMRELFDAIPDVDRAELHGRVSVTDEEGTEITHPFDVILRDRMGNPLLVANVTDGLEATTEPAITELIDAATEIGEHAETLGCALHVTASFFEPGALNAVDEATGGGLLSRDRRESFVKLGRKRGFHLALVESRESEFHVTVPEL